MKNNKTGFTREEALSIAPQVVEDSRLCRKLSKHKYKQIKFSGIQAYVLIDVIGKVSKPRLKNHEYGFTSDPMNIHGFKPREIW